MPRRRFPDKVLARMKRGRLRAQNAKLKEENEKLKKENEKLKSEIEWYKIKVGNMSADAMVARASGV